METPDQQQEQGKVRKRFEKSLATFTQVIGGQFLFKPTKLVPHQVQDAVKELAAEEVKTAIDKFKTDARSLIQKKRDHDKMVSQMKKDFEKKEEESMKKFAEEAEALERTLDNIKNIEKGYFDILMGAATGTTTEDAEKVTD